MSYADGLVAAEPNADKAAYRRHAEAAAEVFKKLGAFSVVEDWGDDVPDGKVISIPMTVECPEEETVCSSWILWPSREVRDEAAPKIMSDVRLPPDANPMPFDGQRIIFGGFEIIVDAWLHLIQAEAGAAASPVPAETSSVGRRKG